MQVVDHINKENSTPYQGIEKMYDEATMHEETYLLVRELIIRGASSEVKPDQREHLVPTLRGASIEVAGWTDVSTLLHVNLRGGNIAAPLP